MTVHDLPAGLIYLASPYTHKCPDVQAMRARTAEQVAAMMLRQGIAVFSPIAYGVALIDRTGHDLGHDYTSWQAVDKRFIAASAAVIVLKLSGWERSVGVADEIAYAKSLGSPVFTLDPKTMDVSTELEVAA